MTTTRTRRKAASAGKTEAASHEALDLAEPSALEAVPLEEVVHMEQEIAHGVIGSEKDAMEALSDLNRAQLDFCTRRFAEVTRLWSGLAGCANPWEAAHCWADYGSRMIGDYSEHAGRVMSLMAKDAFASPPLSR